MDTSFSGDAPRLSLERIVAAAYRAWGRTHFTATSMNMVARELGVTKPAMYRYVRNKATLMAELRRDYAARLDSEIVAPLEQRETDLASARTPAAVKESVRLYLELVFAFFERNPYHYTFYVRYLLGRTLEINPEFRDIVARHDALLLRNLGSPVVTRYVSSTAAYWTTEHYRRDPETGVPRLGIAFAPEQSQLTPVQRTRSIEAAVQRLVHGFIPTTGPATAPQDTQVDLELVERIAWLTPEEMPGPDRVFSAIEQVVQEHGYAGATVELIAERIGITKSSLYQYFGNRDDMLQQLVLRSQQHFAGLARVRLQQLVHPEEQLYAFCVMVASYAVQHTAFMTVENWVRENDVTVELPQEHVEQMQAVFSFLTELVVTGRLTADPGEAFSVLIFIQFLIMQELQIPEQPIQRDQCMQIVRGVFRLFSRGLMGHEFDTQKGGEKK